MFSFVACEGEVEVVCLSSERNSSRAELGSEDEDEKGESGCGSSLSVATTPCRL